MLLPSNSHIKKAKHVSQDMVTFRDFGMGGGGRRGRQRATPIIVAQRLGIKYLKDDRDTFIDGPPVTSAVSPT